MWSDKSTTFVRINRVVSETAQLCDMLPWRRLSRFVLGVFVWAGGLAASADDLPAANDVPKDVLRKAAHVVPTPPQLVWQEMEFIGFAHFGVNTFSDSEWGTGKEDPKSFNPTAFDADQWVAACKDAGIKMLILTCKHHDGFCLWPSNYTEHSVKNSPWRDGKGDVVQEVSDACKRGGIKFGVYLSPWDRHEATYGTDAYNEFYKGQLRELLANYGDVTEVWWDGACGEGPNGKKQEYEWGGYIRAAREMQPDAVLAICGPDVRWVGNEDGLARESEWSVLPLPCASAMTKDLGNRKYLVKARQLGWYPAECDVSIRPGWFYHPKQDGEVKSLKELLDIYYASVGRNSVLLLNIPPDQRGLFHENDVARLRELRATLDETFKTNLATGKAVTASSAATDHAAAAAVDGNGDTYWTTADGVIQASLEFDLGQPATFDRAMLQEMISTGQRVEQFKLEAWDGAAWKEIATATTIGHKRLLRFPAVTASKVRLTILDARDCPTIREFGLFKASAKEE
jgi:alpha-L-fucosidase